MKKNIISLIVFVGLSTISIAGGKDKLTIKEKIDKCDKISYYFDLQPIVHNPKKSSTGKICVKFKETSIFPLSFQSEASNIIDLFSKQLNINSIVAEDINSVPIKTLSGRSMYDYSKGGRKEGDLVIVLTYSGTYNSNKGNTSNPDANWSTVSLIANFTILEVISGGRTKVLKTGVIASYTTSMVESNGCADFAFFTTNFPIENYLENFKESYVRKMTNYTSWIIKKHEKALKKRK